MDQSFDPTIPSFLQGEVSNVAISAPATFPPPALRRLVIDPSKPFDITVEWEIFGALVPLWLAPLAANWDVSVFAESIGPGPEVALGTATVPKTATVPCTVNQAQQNCTKYQATVTVPPGTLTEDVGSDSGTYKLVVTVFLDSALGAPGFDLTGFREGPIIRVENPN
jgi:hypothetical protein